MEQSEKNLSELVDIRDVVIDKSLPLEERVRSMLNRSRIRIALRSEMSLSGYHTQTRTNHLPTALPP